MSIIGGVSQGVLTEAAAVVPSSFKWGVDVFTPNRLKGWLVDTRAPEKKLNLKIILEGVVLASGSADLQRPDLRHFCGDHIGHGFDFKFDGAIIDNPYRVVFTIEETGYELTLPENWSPITINIDRIDDERVSGWAFDGFDPNSHVRLRVLYRGEPYSNLLADEYRKDLSDFGFGGGDHGFTFVAPSDLQFDSAFLVVEPDRKIESSPVRELALEGCVEGCANGIVTGWARDASSPESRLSVRIEVPGAEPVVVVADGLREDLLNAGKGDGLYGFTYEFPFEIDRNSLAVSVLAADAAFLITDYSSPYGLNSSSEINNLEVANKPKVRSSLLAFIDEVSSLIDVKWYQDRYNMDSTVNCIDHYVNIGVFEGKEPCALFDSIWYKKRHLQGASDPLPILHYLQTGAQSGLAPHPLFNPGWYANQFGGIANFNTNVLAHYLDIGRKKGMPTTPLFERAWYSDQYGDDIGSIDPFTHYISAGVFLDYDPNRFFDTKYYLQQVSDFKHGDSPLAHYLETGAARNLDPSPLFSTSGYLRAYSDISRIQANPLEHFIRSGLKEGRSPLGHVAAKTDLANDAPIFSRFGGTEYGPVEKIILYDMPPKTNATTKSICIHIHLFHSDLVDEFLSYLSAIPYNFTLLISVPQNKTENEIRSLSDIIKKSLPQLTDLIIKSVPNVGRDVAPWVVSFGEEILQHDLFFHGHTKKSTYNTSYSTWRRYLLHNTIGSAGIVAQIIELLEKDDKCGLVYPAYFPLLRSQPSWGSSKDIAGKLAEKMNALPPPSICPDYPAGSFFWARVDFLRPLLQCGLKHEDFGSEKGQIDGTLAHAIERLLGDLGRSTGLKKMCVTVDAAYNLTDWWDVKRLSSLTSRGEPRHSYATQCEPLGDNRRIAVYTCITGEFDEFPKPIHVHPDVDYYVFSDKPLKVTWPYKNVVSRYQDVSPRRTARFVKTHPHVLLPGYDVAIWMDANIVAQKSLKPLLASVDDSGAEIGIIHHALRTSYADEAEECARIGADDRELLEKQVFKYKEEGIAEAFLVETNVIVAHLTQFATKSFFNLWWREICSHSLRDQVSVNYAIQESGVKAAEILSQGRTARDSGSFLIFEHKLKDRNAAIGYALASGVSASQRKSK